MGLTQVISSVHNVSSHAARASRIKAYLSRFWASERSLGGNPSDTFQGSSCPRIAIRPMHPHLLRSTRKNRQQHPSRNHYTFFNQEWPRQTKPKKGRFMNFSQGHSGTKVQFVNRACFPKEKHQNSQKWAKFMNFSFWPFLWFGLPGRLLIQVDKPASS